MHLLYLDDAGSFKNPTEDYLVLGGVSVYISTIGLQQRLGVHSAALQTLFWFAMTIIGIALLDGTIAGWSVAQKAVGTAVTIGIGWLLVSAGH